MSYVMKLNNTEIAKTKYWSPDYFASLTNTSFPAEVPDNYVWQHEGYWLGWVPDTPST